jgi:hypothetical protein
VPTYTRLPAFDADWKALSHDDRGRFRAAIAAFVEDLGGGHGFRPGLRVKGVRGRRGVFDMTWAPDGRATFSYGASLQEGEPHVIWRRIGTHSIFSRP